MRDLLYKNLTSGDRKRKIIATRETVDKEGVHSVVRRHFAYMIKEIRDPQQVDRPQPYFFVLKERRTKQCREHFFCKAKGSLLAVHENRLFLVLFIHTLNIELTSSEITLPKTPQSGPTA